MESIDVPLQGHAGPLFVPESNAALLQGFAHIGRIRRFGRCLQTLPVDFTAKGAAELVNQWLPKLKSTFFGWCVSIQP
jgi:hypothetical protein